MGENKGQTIFLSVIGIATLLVAIIGATFAYFTTTMQPGETAGSKVTTATIADATFSVQAGAVKENILPGTEFNPTTVTVSTSGLTGTSVIDYVCTVSLDVTAGTLTNVKWKTEGMADWTDFATKSTFEGQLTSSKKEVSHVVNAKFMELNSGQNDEQGATGNIKVTCALKDANIHYTAE